MKNRRIFLSSPTVNGCEMDYINEAFETNWIAPLGINVDEFECELAKYVGVGYAAALSSGTAALHLAIKLAGVTQGDIVFSSSLTFAATCNPITYEKGIPVFIDSEDDTWNMSPDALEKGFKKYPKVKAVVVANLYGTPAKLDIIKQLCQNYGVPLIEDAAESLGSTYKGMQTGTFGDYGIFSFNGNKIITTSGGGMLVSDDEAAIKKAIFWSTQSRDLARYYQHSEIGYNYRMSNVVAGIGRGQLKTLTKYIEKKQNIYSTYQNAFSDLSDICMNPLSSDGNANNWLSCILIDERCNVLPDQVMDSLESYNIESRPIWKPMQLQPVYKDCDFIQIESRNGVSISEDIFNRGVCLPSDIKNTDEDMKKIIQAIKKLF